MTKISNAEYHADTTHISKSGLDLIAKSPLLFKAKYIDKVEIKPTDAMIFGAAFHSLLLEPERFDDEYFVAPECRRGTKAWKEAEEEAGNKTMIKPADYETMLGMCLAISNHPEAGQYIGVDGDVERPFYADIKDVGVKCRYDKYIPDTCTVIDVKTTADASVYAFTRSIFNFRYHVQAAFYSDILEANGIPVDVFKFLAVEKTPPYQVAVYYLSDEALLKGRELYIRDLNTYRWVKDNNDFFGLNNDEEVEIDLPSWAA